ncbi:MAG TPA: multiheme c-type cytochrome [Gemmatimonadales bacterium]|nr:multiheme c-type cytochrome [Gemmatimonadales bacterium]
MHSATSKRRFGLAAAAVVTMSILAACSTETVFRDRPTFNPPPDGTTSGFLGYYTASTQQTTCGNCHVGQQADWIQTKHASAWGDLQANAHANSSCEGCHSVNSRGNQAMANVGYDSVKSNLYQDVQCEACHGPGYKHVQNPTVVANRPIPSILVYPTSDVTDTAAVVNSACGGCHTDDTPAKHHNYLKEWLSSRHGQLNTHAAPNASCQPCHEGKGALAAWGINTVYQQQGTSTLITQACPICHDPHGTAKDPATGKPWEGQLRFSINTPVIEQNLCTKCHNRQAEPTASGFRGPHGAQGPMLFGTAGYFPPGSSYDTTAILTTHGSSANPRLCAGCHVNSQTGVDASGNSITFSGHSFHPLPCLMQKTPPVVDTTFTNNCAYDEQSRSWLACTGSGCHTGGEAIAVQRLTQFEAERDGYIHTLWVDVNGNQTVDPFPTDSGYLAKVMLNAPNDLDFTNAPYNTILTPAKGALFNAQLTGENLASHPDGSHGVHNPFLYRALLQASIADLLANYGGFLPAPPAPIRAQIDASLRSGFLKMPVATVQAFERAAGTPVAQAVAH